MACNGMFEVACKAMLRNVFLERSFQSEFLSKVFFQSSVQSVMHSDVLKKEKRLPFE